MNGLFEKTSYAADDKRRMLDLMDALGILHGDDGPYVALRRVRGKQFIRRPRQGAPEIVATGRSSWVGWVELKTEQVNATAIRFQLVNIREQERSVLETTIKRSITCYFPSRFSPVCLRLAFSERVPGQARIQSVGLFMKI